MNPTISLTVAEMAEMAEMEVYEKKDSLSLTFISAKIRCWAELAQLCSRPPIRAGA